ncbi:MAG: glycosyltransferase family 39 protein [Candidatus Aenigmarchaeota archaeon]|nr:glycosyltransferase family 39 protein [Candidatus Aenigmarchaeota archaeon]
MKINKDYIAIAMILILFILYLNVTLKSPIVFGDEGYYAYQARWISENNMMPNYEMFKDTNVFHLPFTKPPLFVLTEAFGFMLGETFVKFLIPVFAALGALMLYIFLKKTVNAKAGLGAALLYMSTPSLITYGVLGYVDSLLCLLMICSLYFGYLTFEHGEKKNAILTGLFTGLAILTKITAPILLVIFVLYFIIFKKYDKLKLLLIIIAISAVVVAPWIIRNFALFGNYCYGPTDCPAIISDSRAVETELQKQFAGTNAGGSTDASLAKLGTISYTDFAYGWVIIFLAIFGIVQALTEKKNIQILFVILMICMLPIFILYSTRVEDTARYTLPVVIGMSALGGIFLAKSYDHIKQKNFAIALFLIIIILSGAWVFGQNKLNAMVSVKAFSTGFFDACDWVEKSTPEDSLLLSIYSQQTAYNCNRRVSTAIPDMAEVVLTNNEVSYEHLKMHGYNYVFVQVGLISQVPYEENVPYDFFNFMYTSPHFEKVFDNTNVYGNGGVIIFKVN